MAFYDGLINFANGLINKRNALNQNAPARSTKINDEVLNTLYKSGIGSKIIRLKVAYALNDTISFDSEDDEQFYKNKLYRHVKLAAQYMMGFGRAIIVIHSKGVRLDEPLSLNDNLIINVFSGRMVSPVGVDLDISSERYMKPYYYMVRGQQIHHSRVVDFTYYKPEELDLQNYDYGGISEFELIYKQLIADGVIERAVPSILDKCSTIFYKVPQFKQLLQSKQHQSLIEFFTRLEDLRSNYGAGIIDAEDEIAVVSQSLTNLSESDQITLRRIAMVTGIPLPMLIGENVKGLGSSGNIERQSFQDTIENFQFDYCEPPIDELMEKCGRAGVSFKDNQGGSPEERIDYESKAIDNAVKLDSLGEDGIAYLVDKKVINQNPVDNIFPELKEIFNEKGNRGESAKDNQDAEITKSTREQITPII